MEEDNHNLRIPEVQLSIELEKIVEDNFRMVYPEVQLTTKLENVRRQLQSSKREVQLQLT
jgi:hypothetical protein